MTGARRPRIAVAYDCLFPYTTGGGERLYRRYAEELTELGADVDYLTATQWDGDQPPAESFRIVPVTGRLSLYDAEGVRRSSTALRFAWALMRALRARRRDYDAVIVSGLPVLNVFAARLALAGTRTPLLFDYLEVWGRAQWAEYAGFAVGNVAWALQRLALALTPTAASHSALTTDRLRSEGFRREVLQSPGLIDDAVPPAFVAEAETPPFVVYAGRHIADKRVETLPAAVAYARRSIPDLRLVILGAGATTDVVRSAVRAVDGETWTDLPGFVDTEQLDRLMAGAVCLANPSRREGYGLVVVESAGHGTPVVLVADPGNAATELIAAGENGFVAASADAADLGRAIAEVFAGGAALRARTRAWYDEAVTTRSIRRTVANIFGWATRQHDTAQRARTQDEEH